MARSSQRMQKQRKRDRRRATPAVVTAPGPAPELIDVLAAAIVMLFAMAMVVRPLPNLDLYWLLAVGRRIVETRTYIFEDPFTFTVAGTPWSPLSYLSGLVFYGLSKLGGMTAIGVVRVLLVGTMTWLMFRALKRIGVSWAIAAPLVVVALIVSHSRLTDRGQIFEYVFIAWLMGFLLTSHDRRGRSFFVPPLLIQLAWVQLHSSFLLGPVLVAIFFLCEWIAAHTPVTEPLARRDFKRPAALVGLMALVCLINPNPKFFLFQPFDPAQRELMTRYTLEWKSPFDPAMSSANFHPYYEVLLVAAAIAALIRLKRLPLAPVAVMAATALLSFQSHRLRVEFALVAVPMIALLLKDAPLVALARRIWPSRAVWSSIGLALALSIMVAERERFLESQDIPELYPDEAFAFMVEHDIAKRPFTTIGFGSYLLWDQYGKRSTFIDGRNFDPALYRDFLEAQTRETSWRAISRKYKLDSFILPPPERADGGVRNLHVWLRKARDWTLVHTNERAHIYVRNATVDPQWLDEHRINPASSR